MGRPVAASQSRAVWSWLPVRTTLPSGLNATALTKPRCGRGGPTGRPVAASQSRAVRSSLPVRTALPSGLNATALTSPWCEKTAFTAKTWLCQAAMLARAVCSQPGSPAATADCQLLTRQSRPAPICSFSNKD